MVTTDLTQTIVDREQPHDDNTEAALLGTIINGYPPEDIRLQPTDFHNPWHAEVWATCQQLTLNHQRPDITLLANTLHGRHLDLFELAQNAGIPSNVPEYEKIITELSSRRWMLNLLAGAWQKAATHNAADMANQLRTMLDTREIATTEAKPLAHIIPTMLERMEKGNLRGDTTPWPELDKWITLQPGRLYTIAARPGIGKSIFGQAIASHMSRTHNKATFVASLEMPDDEYIQRFIAAESGIPLSTLDKGALTDPQWNHLANTTTKLNGWNIYVNDSSRQTLTSIRADARMVSRRHTLGAIVIDYLQLVTPADRKTNREQQVASLTAGFKGLAKDLNIPVILIAQLNRENIRDKRRPRLSDLRESGAIEQDSDAVLLLHEPEPGDDLELLIAKNRGGRNNGTIRLTRQGWLARLVQPEPEPPTHYPNPYKED